MALSSFTCRKTKVDHLSILVCVLLSFLLVTGCSPTPDTESRISPDLYTHAADTTLPDGEYQMEVTLEGGSGKAGISSPCLVSVSGGKAVAVIEWSGPYYDYMVIDGITYRPVDVSGNSRFNIPITVFDSPMAVTADTTAMGAPHEIEYTLTFETPGR